MEPYRKLTLEETLELIRKGEKYQKYPKNAMKFWAITEPIRCNACGYITQIIAAGAWVWTSKDEDKDISLCSDCYKNFKPLVSYCSCNIL
jgi:hypothetical protein